MSRQKLLISFSGGRTSAYMTKLLLDNWSDTHEIVVVYANTGKEREETLKFIKKCDDEFGFNTVWIETVMNQINGKGCSFKIVDYYTASRNGEPFEDVIKKHGIPNAATPHCSREMKSSPVNKYINSLGWKDYKVALGIRIDELKRAKEKPKVIYPLVKDFPTTKLKVNQWWNLQKFNLELKGYEGNCDLCWKKSKRKLLTIIHENPSFIDWWNQMELKYGEYIPESRQHNDKIKPPFTFFRNSESASDYLEDSKIPFIKAKDDYTLNELMFSEPELDFTNGCEESCEAF